MCHYYVIIAKADPYNIDHEHNHVYTLRIHHSFEQHCFQVEHDEVL